MSACGTRISRGLFRSRGRPDGRGPASRHHQRQVAKGGGAAPRATRHLARHRHRDCFEQWKSDRQQANKKTTRHGADEKELAIDDFQKRARVRDIGEITRAHIIAFRDHLFTTGLKTPTVNKRVGQITTLLATAQRAGWIDTAITGGIYIEIPAGTNEREPFDRA
ncbi:phage integrase SAM-like domain-containing protein [Methylosinus sp. PW1]|uniref:phage integrase SAM-like domain-containing protein n=1 Tax=Methylosinus sp. PW1 TaxID=107636 RepID=UPI003525047A